MDTSPLQVLSDLTIKDWIILGVLALLIFCIREIRRLKNIIVYEVRKKLIPQLILEAIYPERASNWGFYLKNESVFLARDITVEDLELALDDTGFKTKLTLKFDNLEYLKQGEKAELTFKVFSQGYYSAEITERIMAHLLNTPPFKIKITYANIENLKFCATFIKKEERFQLAKLESLE